MSLRDAPFLYVFVDVHGLDRQRELLEAAVGLPVIEVEPHLPHHRHGAVKYDAGAVIWSLNLASPGKFRPDQSDAYVTVFSVDPGVDLAKRVRPYGQVVRQDDGELLTDASGHHYLFRPCEPGAAVPATPVITEIRLRVKDLDESVRFYSDLLGLDVRERTAASARVATGTIDLLLERGDVTPDGRTPTRRTTLFVFFTSTIEATRTALEERGVDFGNKHAAYSEIGGTARFDDPSGHRFCLYEPSEECLTWESGAMVLSLTGTHASMR